MLCVYTPAVSLFLGLTRIKTFNIYIRAIFIFAPNYIYTRNSPDTLSLFVFHYTPHIQHSISISVNFITHYIYIQARGRLRILISNYIHPRAYSRALWLSSLSRSRSLVIKGAAAAAARSLNPAEKKMYIYKSNNAPARDYAIRVYSAECLRKIIKIEEHTHIHSILVSDKNRERENSGEY